MLAVYKVRNDPLSIAAELVTVLPACGLETSEPPPTQPVALVATTSIVADI